MVRAIHQKAKPKKRVARKRAKRAARTRPSRKRTVRPAETRPARRAPAGIRVGKHYVRYSGTDVIRLATSTDGRTWRTRDDHVLEPRGPFFDDGPLTALQPAKATTDGILVIYYVTKPLAFGAAVFDKRDPAKLLRRSERAFWSTDDDATPISVEFHADEVVLLLRSPQSGDIRVSIPLSRIFGTQRTVPLPRIRHEPILRRHTENPIITPRGHHEWESVATFNPAALHLQDKVHILYRAVGADGVSMTGYASSEDGVRIDERLPHPVFVPTSPFDRPNGDPGAERYPSFSGGGFGGCEDPRLAEVDGRVYMTYTAFDGRHPPGVALTSIGTEDFLAHRWNWEKPALISKPGEQHKNWVIFPKKIHGKYAVLHSISPRVLIDYFDRLDFTDGAYIKSTYTGKGAPNRWDDMPRGVGAPPIETPDGWLVLYHAMDSRDPNRYKVGALLLDKNEPTKIVSRSPGPVLEPDEVYENSGYKSGVVYVCGAVILKDTLYVYYGGADTVTCVASYPLKEFLSHIIKR
jgi:predicted GH43/DUF377 family glycosyl hydrolase